MTYATPEEITIAEELGYQWDVDTRRGHRFEHGKRHIWAASYYQDGERHPGWQTADLERGVDGSRYANHQMFTRLEDALRRRL